MKTLEERVRVLSAELIAAYKQAHCAVPIEDNEDLTAGLTALEQGFLAAVAGLQVKVEALELRLRGLPCEELN